MVEYVVAPGLPTSHTAHGIRAGNLLFIGGQVPTDESGALVGSGDIRAQADQVFRNIGRVLEAADARFDQIVRLETYYRDTTHLSAILDVREKFLRGHRPCTTAVVVESLSQTEWLIEVQAIAVVE